MRRYRQGKGNFYMNTGKRNVSVSVRLPKYIYDIVNEYEGTTFTDKLINLIFDYKEFYDLKKPD